jgi:CheY-like chemotaxis protein
MFMQGDVSLERTKAGLGVGLTLVRNLVALHGGSVDVRSDGVGLGSEFAVTLPIDPATQAAPTDRAVVDSAPKSRPLKILVADDNEDGREMLAFLLAAEGHEVEQAADGPTALETAAVFQPDVAILDIGMPGMNGFKLAETLRAGPHSSSLVLVALSGLGQQEDKTRAAQAGFDRHFTKPVDIQMLRTLLATAGRELSG